MTNEDSLKFDRKPAHRSQRFFATRDIHISLAVLIVISLLGGIFLQILSFWLLNDFGLNPVITGILLIIGYGAIVTILSLFFADRLVGPFKRIEYEMKLISNGELDRRLSVRGGDDLHVKNFVRFANVFISNFEEMSLEYNKLNSAISTKMSHLSQEFSKESLDCGRVKGEIEELQKVIREFREKW